LTAKLGRNSRSADKHTLIIDSIGIIAKSLKSYLFNGTAIAQNPLAPERDRNAHRNAIEMAANEDGSQWTRDKRPRSATQFGAQCGLNSA
jgi:hypothetical protein